MANKIWPTTVIISFFTSGIICIEALRALSVSTACELSLGVTVTKYMYKYYVYGHLCVWRLSFIQQVCQFMTNIKTWWSDYLKNDPVSCTKYCTWNKQKNGIDSVKIKGSRKKESKATQIGNKGNSKWEQFNFYLLFSYPGSVLLY
jgi:hypothetical protein